MEKSFKTQAQYWVGTAPGLLCEAWPPAIRHGWRRCCMTEEGGGAWAMLARAADRQDRATTGPGGAAVGCGRE
jgi:hypothetical protein